MCYSRNTTLERGCYYHIFNRDINGTPLFYSPHNYKYFLWLYHKYVTPIAETYAWCLMGNHLHLLERGKVEDEMLIFPPSSNPYRVQKPVRVISGNTIKAPHLYFSPLFNANAQASNKQQGRTAALFERPFHRIKITSELYFLSLVVYIHQNPVHHRFTSDFRNHPWSSYGSIVSTKPSKIMRDAVLEWFRGKDNFIGFHKVIVNLDLIQEI